MAHKSNCENGWQDLKPNVHARISHLLQNDFMSDFTFVSEDVKFPVHKFVLASTSSVFYPMFYGRMAEKKQELDLSSFGNADCISEFLKFLYTDEVLLNWGNVFRILNLSKCYSIVTLQERCTNFIEKSVRKENVLIALPQSLLFDENAAVAKCLEIIAENASEIVKQDSFLALDLASLTAILKSDTLNIEEIDLFLAVDKWCERQLIKEGKESSPELKRKLLGDAVFLIRFPTMELKDFGENCSKSGILIPEQVIDIIHYISLEGKDLQKSVGDKMAFSRNPRKGQQRQEIIADRIAKSSKYSIWNGYSHQRSDAIDFTINKKAYLTGISLFGDPNSNTISEMTITTNAGTFKPTFTFGEPNSGPVSESFRVSFEQPIEILAGQKVNVCVLIAGPSSKGISGFAKQTFKFKGFECGFSTTSNSSNGTDVNYGQFPALIFEM